MWCSSLKMYGARVLDGEWTVHRDVRKLNHDNWENRVEFVACAGMMLLNVTMQYIADVAHRVTAWTEAAHFCSGGSQHVAMCIRAGTSCGSTSFFVYFRVPRHFEF